MFGYSRFGMSAIAEPNSITPQQADVARLTRQVLAPLQGDVRLDLKSGSEPAASIVLPAPAVRLLIEILGGIADGREMRVNAVATELSVRQTAESLDVPESVVTELIDRGTLFARLSGSGPMISAADIESYKSNLKQKRIEVLSELQAQAQELGLGY